MRAILAFVMILASGYTLADTTLETGISGGGAADMLNQTKPPSFIEGGESKPEPKVRLVSSCKTKDGTTYTKDQPGYGRCMQESSARTTSGDKKGDSTNEVGFKVGE